jgi:gas vesicle protein
MKSVLSFVIGLSVGAVVALLSTPQSGEETRAWLSRKAEEMSEIPQEKAAQVAEAAKERAGDLGSQIGRRAAEATVEAAKENILPTDKSA